LTTSFFIGRLVENQASARTSGSYGRSRMYEVTNQGKDPKMLQRFQDISVLPDKEKECLLTTVDHFIKASKISLM
jgi:hypothetical protein